MSWSRRNWQGADPYLVLAVGFISLGIRFYWNTKVQHPLDAVYSDMAGYYNRAVDVVKHRTEGDPRMYVLSPWGAHGITAAELWLVGRKNHLGIAIFHAIATTIPVMCTMVLTARVTRSTAWSVIAGLVAAFWQPAIAHGGYFMSENWYAALISLGTVFLLRFLENRNRPYFDATISGVSFALAATVRPQILLTYAIAGAFLLLIIFFRSKRATFWRRSRLQHYVAFTVPLVVLLGISAWRMHHYAGHWGLVSENGPINKIWGMTHIAKVEAHWKMPDGGSYWVWYSPPPKGPAAPEDSVVVDGHIGDAEVMNKIFEEHLPRENRAQRIHRAIWNVKLLATNVPFPESGRVWDPKATPVRSWLQLTWQKIILDLLPLAFFGLGTMLFGGRTGKRYGFFAGLIFVAHALTAVVTAVIYLGEGRFRIPYDPFLLTAAIAGLAYVFGLLRRAYVMYRPPLT